MVQPLTGILGSSNKDPRSPHWFAQFAVRVFRRIWIKAAKSAREEPAFAVIALTALLIAGYTIARQRASTGTPAKAPLTVRVTVAPGDSLWSLARRYGDPDDYIEDNVDAMARANGMRSKSNLVVGQRLLVSVANPTELASLQKHIASTR